jgi:hypothetical protein
MSKRVALDAKRSIHHPTNNQKPEKKTKKIFFMKEIINKYVQF